MIIVVGDALNLLDIINILQAKHQQRHWDILNDLTAKFGARFKPAQILIDYAKSGKKFYDS